MDYNDWYMADYDKRIGMGFELKDKWKKKTTNPKVASYCHVV